MDDDDDGIETTLCSNKANNGSAFSLTTTTDKRKSCQRPITLNDDNETDTHCTQKKKLWCG